MPDATANVPNPFCGFGKGIETNCILNPNYTTLYLDDGGDNYQNIPLVPLLQPSRNLDTIIAVDSSDDSGDGYGTCCGYNWPQGAALDWTRSYALSHRGQEQNLAFPEAATLPSDNQALYYTPTFFGCNASDTTLPGVVPPLVIYLPNAPYSAFSNGTSGATATWAWGNVAADLFANGVALGSTGLGTTASGIPDWDTCLACAVADRARLRAGITDRSPACVECFAAYCAETKLPIGGLVGSNGMYDPPSVLDDALTQASDSYCYVSPACGWDLVPPYYPTCCADCDYTFPPECYDMFGWDIPDCSTFGIGTYDCSWASSEAPLDDSRYLEL